MQEVPTISPIWHMMMSTQPGYIIDCVHWNSFQFLGYELAGVTAQHSPPGLFGLTYSGAAGPRPLHSSLGPPPMRALPPTPAFQGNNTHNEASPSPCAVSHCTDTYATSHTTPAPSSTTTSASASTSSTPCPSTPSSPTKHQAAPVFETYSVDMLDTYTNFPAHHTGLACVIDQGGFVNIANLPAPASRSRTVRNAVRRIGSRMLIC